MKSRVLVWYLQSDISLENSANFVPSIQPDRVIYHYPSSRINGWYEICSKCKKCANLKMRKIILKMRLARHLQRVHAFRCTDVQVYGCSPPRMGSAFCRTSVGGGVAGACVRVRY